MTLKKENIKRIAFVIIILFLFLTLTGCGSEMDDQPLNGFTDEVDILGWIFVYPIGWIMSKIGSIFNGSYGLAILFTTLLVRFGAWPIYAGTSNMSVNMQLAKPDLDKLNAKYLGKTDPESMQRKQQETMLIYKKHNVNFKSCLATPIQMFLFIGLTRAMTRIAIEGGSLSLSNFNFLGFDLRGSLFDGTYGIGNQIFTGVLVLLVAASSFGHQFYMQKRQESLNKNNPQPQQQADSAAMMQRTMKMMLYIFPIGLAVMAAGSTAYAFYWTIGNTCSFITMIITKKIGDKKIAASKEANKDSVDVFDAPKKKATPKKEVVVEEEVDPFESVLATKEATNKTKDNDVIDIE